MTEIKFTPESPGQCSRCGVVAAIRDESSIIYCDSGLGGCGRPTFSSSEKFHDDRMFERAVTSNGHGPLATTAETNPDALFDGYAATDIGNGHRLCRHHGDKVRWVPEWGHLVWSGSRWKKDDTEGMSRIAKDTIRAMIEDAGSHLRDWASDKDEVKKGKALLKHAETSQSMGRMKAMIEASRSEPGIVMRPTEFDTDQFLFNAENCTVDLRTGLAQKQMESDYITKKSPTIFTEEARAPTWEKFLLDVFKTQEMVDYMQRVLGYCMTGDTREQCVFILHGTGSNGKSTLLNTVLRVIGTDYASQLNSNTITEHKEGSANNDVAALQGIRMVSCIEVGSGKRLNEELVKQFTGQDRIRARFLYKESFEFEQQFKLLIAANHKPEVRGQDYAMWRRVRLVPFLRTFKEDEKDVLLGTKLLAESSGILAWLVRGAKAWLGTGLLTPATVKEATLEYKDEMNDLGEFIGVCFVGPDLSCGASELYRSYRDWCENRGDKPMSQTAFGRRLDDLGFGSERKASVRMRLGISVVPPPRTVKETLDGVSGYPQNE
jgi:putative DNA primase/helicase